MSSYDPPAAPLAAKRRAGRMRLMRPKTGADRRIEILNSSRRKLVDMRADLCNTLRSTLKGYYPLALEVGGELGTLLNCEFLIKWSSVDELKRARRNTVRAFSTPTARVGPTLSKAGWTRSPPPSLSAKIPT